MYIKYLQIALNYRTRCRLPRTAKCTAYHQGRGGEGGDGQCKCKCKWKWKEEWDWEKWSNIGSASNCCLLHIQFEWLNRPAQPGPAQRKQSGWTEACLSIPLTKGISQYQSLCLSRSPSIHLAILVDCPTCILRWIWLTACKFVSICCVFPLRLPLGYQWTLHTVQQWSQTEREVVEKILPKVEDKV